MAIVTDAAGGMRAAHRATILQLRNPAATTRELEQQATRLVKSSPLPVLISSRCDVALAVGAAGVNLPERDIDIEFARGLVRRGLIGRSVHSQEAAVRAQFEGADFVIFGPVWRSASHTDREPAGVEVLESVASAVRIPVVAIGGVTEERIPQVHAAGAAGYAAIGIFK